MAIDDIGTTGTAAANYTDGTGLAGALALALHTQMAALGHSYNYEAHMAPVALATALNSVLPNYLLKDGSRAMDAGYAPTPASQDVATAAYAESAAGGGLQSRTIYATPGSSGTYTVPAGITLIRVRMWGGGGGGGGVSGVGGGQSAGAGGGGAGAHIEHWMAVAPGQTATYEVGAGGAGGSAGVNAGAAGVRSRFVKGVTYHAGSGGGGYPMASDTYARSAIGGAGGAALYNGDIRGNGAPGSFGVRFSGSYAQSGFGASTSVGGGGASRFSTAEGLPGVGYGAGGGGACQVGGLSRAGGSGAGGLIIIEEYA